MQFTNLKKSQDNLSYTFTLANTNVTYANTLRRLILTGVETVAFRSDMTSNGTTTDVIIKKNDTPMTNEMLAARIGLIPINIKEPLKWKSDNYLFSINVSSDKNNVKYVKASDFVVSDIEIKNDDAKYDQKEEPTIISTKDFFPPNHITGDTCLIAFLQPGSGSQQQTVEIVAKATIGTGREHARFSPVSQCSYEYTPDTNEQRIQEMFLSWLTVAKKVSNIDKESQRYKDLYNEFKTMQIKRCFMIDEKGEPYSFDFTVETIGVLSVPYIVERACEVGENMCSRYANINQGDLPDEITISSADCKLSGFDFLVRGHDHTLGNLLQTWIVENIIEKNIDPNITYAGYCVPHPLRDEMVLRIGVKDGNESSARKAFSQAAKGCVQIFQSLRTAWRNSIGSPMIPSSISKTIRRKTPKIMSKP